MFFETKHGYLGAYFNDGLTRWVHEQQLVKVLCVSAVFHVRMSVYNFNLAAKPILWSSCTTQAWELEQFCAKASKTSNVVLTTTKHSNKEQKQRQQQRRHLILSQP